MPSPAEQAATRVAEATDAGRVAQLHVESWRAAYRAELPSTYLDGLDVTARTAMWSERIADPQMAVVLRESPTALLAFCASGPSRDADVDSSTVWEIQNLHVSPELRGGGIGVVLFDDALERARQRRATDVTLWVVVTNAPARRFYERRGMIPDGGTQQHILEPGVSLDEMRYRRSTEPTSARGDH